MPITLQSLRDSLPSNGLFGAGSWRWSPEPFKLSKKLAQSLMALGHPLASFQQSCDTLYRRSAHRSAPPWIAEWLNRGKPDWLISHQLHSKLAQQFPAVTRPDLLLTETGFALTELDSVPGGIGVTAWLSQYYSNAGFDVLGGASGMIHGFRSLMPNGGTILISEESKDYKPEMAWLSNQLGPEWPIAQAETWTCNDSAVYRFFEMFDWRAIPCVHDLANQAIRHPHSVLSPFKPHLEDKLWLALLWNPSLASLWKTSLRSNHLQTLRSIVPYGWVLDPTPLPPHAAIPRLNAHSWPEIGNLSQKDRQLVLKISGFHETAWGARGVFVGHDMPTHEWKSQIDQALKQAPTHPWIMQEFSESKIIEHPYFLDDGSITTMQGRVRLCPYFFTPPSGKSEFAGCLATIVPADKKKIHGMSDAILVPCMIDPNEQ